MPRINVTVTEEMVEALEEYRQRKGMKSTSEALVRVAAWALNVENPKRAWGGDRKSKQYRNE